MQTSVKYSIRQCSGKTLPPWHRLRQKSIQPPNYRGNFGDSPSQYIEKATSLVSVIASTAKQTQFAGAKTATAIHPVIPFSNLKHSQ